MKCLGCLSARFVGGETVGILATTWLILVAAAFGTVAAHAEILVRVIKSVINWIKGPTTLILSNMLASNSLNTLAADPLWAFMISRMFRGEYI